MDYILGVLSLGWVGSLVGLGGIVIGFLLFLKSKARYKLIYQTGNIRLVGQHGELPREVTVTFRDVPVKALTMTTVAIWNSGNTTLDGSAVATNDPLRLEFGQEAKVLSAELVKVSRSVVNFAASIPAEREDVVSIGFDFLDPDDGALLRVLHAGGKVRARMRGTVKGMPQGCIDAGPIPTVEIAGKAGLRQLRLMRVLSSIVVVAMGSILLSSGVSPTIWEIVNTWPGRPTEDATAWLLVLLGSVLVLLGVSVLLTFRRRYPKSLALEDAPRTQEKE